MLYGQAKFTKMLSKVPEAKLREAWEMARPVPPEVFAEKVLDRIARNKAIIIVPGWWRLFWWIYRFSPSLGLSLARSNFRKWQDAIT